MPNQERTFEAGGKTYTIRFTQNALYKLEKELARPLYAALGNLGLVEVQVMLWAGLEGARLKRRSASASSLPDQGESTERVNGRPPDRPFTIEDAGDLIDELGGVNRALSVVMDAWRAAMPSREVGAAAESGNAAADPTRG